MNNPIDTPKDIVLERKLVEQELMRRDIDITTYETNNSMKCDFCPGTTDVEQVPFADRGEPYGPEYAKVCIDCRRDHPKLEP